MHNNENISHLYKWLSNILDTQESPVEFKSNIVVQTPWSLVIKVDLGQDCYYLKQTPPDLFIEPEIINVIQKYMPDSPTPIILFKNNELNSYVMKSCGDHSLRTKFNGSIDAELLFCGLKSYIKIQRSLEPHLDALEVIGVPDWRINHFPDLYVDLLEKKDVLLDEGLTLDELDKLMRLVPTIKSICESLSKYKIKNTLVCCDFNENNMIINEDTQQISIIDLSETVISHPFFSIAAHLRNNARRYQLELNGQLLASIKQQWLSCWSDLVNKNELDEIYQHILRLIATDRTKTRLRFLTDSPNLYCLLNNR